MFERYFTKNRNKLRGITFADHTPHQEENVADYEANDLMNYNEAGNGDDVELPNIGSSGNGASPLIGFGGLTQMNAPTMTNNKLDFYSKVFEDIFQDEKFMMKQGG